MKRKIRKKKATERMNTHWFLSRSQFGRNTPDFFLPDFFFFFPILLDSSVIQFVSYSLLY